MNLLMNYIYDRIIFIFPLVVINMLGILFLLAAWITDFMPLERKRKVLEYQYLIFYIVLILSIVALLLLDYAHYIYYEL